MFEKIDFLHRLYPVYLLGARMVAWLTYEDIDTHNFIVLQHLHAKTDQLMLMIRQMQLETGSGTTRKEGKSDEALTPDTVDPAGDPWHASALEERYRPMHPAMIGQSPSTGAKSPKTSAGSQRRGSGRGVGSLVWVAGTYFFFQWLLGRKA